MLYKAGLEARAFKSAESALAAMAQNLQPDLIITDVYLPGIDGWRFCRLLRSQEYEHFNLTPILVVSATFSGEEPSRITADLGANAFLSMPVDGQQFIEQIRTLLKGETPQAMLKALIVEDSKLISMRLVKAFQAQGYQTHAALTYQAALSTLGESAYDIAVIDYHLPDGLGDGLLEALQEKSPDCVCLMMTADPQPELALIWMKMGAAAYLHKPFEPEYLIALCERARRERALVRSQNLLEMRTRQLHESEQKYRSLIQYSSDPIFAFNPDESYRFVNEAFARPFGKKPEEIVGKTPFDIFPFEEAEKRLRLVRRVFATCENEEIEVKVITYTGEERYYLTLADPIKDDRGKVLYVTCISKDITERKRVTDALRESEERYRTVVEWSPEPFVVHRNGKLIFSNTAAIHLFGASSRQDL
ncbi:MAG: response regulator, partial [Chloroflexi bacterium]|nr:response regulator [Chloroflexota bacterium]